MHLGSDSGLKQREKRVPVGQVLLETRCEELRAESPRLLGVEAGVGAAVTSSMLKSLAPINLPLGSVHRDHFFSERKLKLVQGAIGRTSLSTSILPCALTSPASFVRSGVRAEAASSMPKSLAPKNLPLAR